MNSIAKNIRTQREMRNMSQEELASKMRVGQKRIEEYESGELVPSTDTILRLSTVLDIPISMLTGSTKQSSSGVEHQI